MAALVAAGFTYGDDFTLVFADTTPPYTPWPGAQGRNGTPHPTGTPNGYAAPAQPSSLVTLQNAP